MPEEKSFGRYRVLEELGRGGMGVVYLAEDEGGERRVALKVLLARRFTDSGLRHFEQEFRTLTSLSHPNLTEVYDFGRARIEDGDRQVPFFTMEFVDGVTLDRHLDAGEGFPALYDCLAQVGQALAYLHGRGVVHQDVKPSNILVTGRGDSRHVKLMDLGLAGGAQDTGVPGRIRGTAAYLSPEAARGGSVDPRADLYSLGCVAYRMATGRPPFQGGSTLELLRAHLQEEPLAPSTLNREIPRPFEALILSLLQKDPGLRPATADRFLSELNDVAGGTLHVESAETRRHRVLGPGFVGRDTELDRLANLLAEAGRGRGRVVFLVGEAGVGKSRLLREFQVRSQLDDLDVFVGRPDGMPASRCTFGDALARAVRSRGPLSDALLERHGDALDSLIGTLDGSAGSRPAGDLAFGDDRYELYGAVSAAVDELSRDEPLVIAIEDLHRADETTCRLLAHLAAHAPGTPVLLLGTFRTDEVSRSSPLFDLLAEGRPEGTFEEIFLKPLGPAGTEQMVRAMLGSPEVPRLFLQRILEETHGNPLYLQELVALLAEEGLVEPGAEQPPDPEVLNRVELPGKVLNLLERRFARLSEDGRGVLGEAAVLGAPGIDPDAVAAVSGRKWEAVVRELLELHAAGLVHREEDEGGTPVYHTIPALAAIAESSLSDEQARRLHAGAVAYLERRGIPRSHGAWAAFARHAEAAGQPGRAMEASGRAGDLARELHAHREAIELYGRAIELALRDEASPAAVVCGLYARRGESYARVGEHQRAEEDYRWMLARAEKAGHDGMRAGAHLALGRVLDEAGRFDDARDNLEIALEIARRIDDPSLDARARIALGRVTFHLGEYDDGVEQFDRACASARRAERSELEVDALLAKGMLLREQGNYRLSLEAFRQAGERTSGRASAEVEEAIEEGSALALEVQGRHEEAVAAYERARDRARQRGDVRAAAALTTHLGTAHMKVGAHDEARRELEEALQAQRRLGSREGQLLAQHGLAVLHVYRGRYDDGIETAEEALRTARGLRNRERVAAALHLIGGIHLRVGDLDGAAERLDEAHRIARELRSPRALAASLAELGELHRARGDGEAARRELQEAAFLARKVGDRRLESSALTRLGEAHLLDNNHDRAGVACRKALELVEGSGLPREEADARLLRARIELGRPGGDVVRAEMDALSALESYHALNEPEQTWQAEHLVARAALRLGRRDEAAARIASAHRYVENVRGRLSSRFRESFAGDPRRRELFDDYERMRGRVPDAGEDDTAFRDAVGGDYARLQEEAASLRRLLETNRQLGSAREPGELAERILASATELTGAKRGVVVWSDGLEVVARTGDSPGPAELALARAVARQVLEAREPLLSATAGTDERLAAVEGVQERGVGSVLAVPLRIRDDVVGVVHLERHHEEGSFTTVHAETASRLAELAGLALDNVRLMQTIREQSERVERLNRELELTVQNQRTELASVREELSFTRSSFELRYRFEDLVGASSSMQRVYHLVERLAPKRLPVLITGESGTGKELIARALHANSDRSEGPFFSINCAALTETLLESELFGYRRGAFTGADRDKPGYFELAHGGTLFLDELGDMGLPVQAKLLRAIERGEVLPVGGSSRVKVDVRVVSATHRDLEAKMADGSFREDLFYRINVGVVHLPPLRERLDDIPLLVDHFLTLLAEDEGQDKRDIEPAALERLASHDWPGNVRELHHRILRIAAFSKGATLTLKDVRRYADLPAPGTGTAETPGGGRLESLEELERKQILRAIDEAGGNKTRAAELLGINRATLFRKLKRLGL